MACDLETILADACTSDIGKIESELTLLRVIAQLSAEQLVADVPGTDVTLEAILGRACTSGIGKLEDPITLMKVIAQNGCDAVA